MYIPSHSRTLLVPRSPRPQCSHLLLPSQAARRRLHHPIRSMLNPTRLPIHERRLPHRPRALPNTPRLRGTMRPRPPVSHPIIPAPRILAHIRIPSLPRNARRSPAPHARLAEENHLLSRRRLLEAELVFELVGGEEERIRAGGDGQVDGGGDAVFAELVRFADVD